MINFRMLKLSDPWLWGAVGCLIFLSLLAIFSTTYASQIKIGGEPLLFVKRQFISLLLGVLGLGLCSYFDYRYLKKIAPILYGLTLLLLVLILFIGGEAHGAQRWVQLGLFSFQPSELSKIIMIIVLARYFSGQREMQNPLDALLLLTMVGMPFLLIFKQPDLGTALVFLVILLGMLTSSGFSNKMLWVLVTPFFSLVLRPVLTLWLIYILVLVLVLFLTRASVWEWVLILGANIAVGIAVPFIWGMLKSYQQARIISFLNPGADPQGVGYHTLQSKIAIGNGGLIGTGLLKGSQTQLQFIPEQFSDFIFSAIGEEFGFLGAGLVLSCLAIIIWRAFVIAQNSVDRFGSLLASGIAVMIGFHTIANIGMTVGLLPVVGIPLPFVSYGGTALIMNLMALGILQNIYMRRQKLIF
jgi:rod shape determining protein RodA